MTTYGLVPTGFVPKTMEVAVDEMRAAFRAAFSAAMPLGDGEFTGQAIRITAEQVGALWDGLQAIYSAFDPDAATGAPLDALCALTGTVRDPARASTVPVYLTGVPGTPVPAASRVRTLSVLKYAGPGEEFETDEDVTIAAAVAWAATTAYVVGDIRYNVNGVYIVTTAGTTGGGGGWVGPNGKGTGIVDGTVLWSFLGLGTGYVVAATTAAATGAVEAVARTLTEIRTPIGGWQSSINVEDAVPGADAQVDASLRVSRLAELSGAGSATANAIRANVLQVTGVTTCRVFYNNTDTTDVDGVPGHGIEVLVQGGSDQVIADVLLDSVALGISYAGTTTMSATDSYGTAHTIKFTRPAEIKIFVAITLIVDTSSYPADGDTQVKDAIVAYAAGVSVGRNAVSSVIGAQALAVDGVLEITSTFIKFTAGPTLPTTLTITDRQILTIETGNISVATSSGTP